jgi:hypothetical protein
VVIEAGSPTPIAGASVLGEHGDIAVTDIDGYFTLVLDDRERELTIAAAGYVAKAITLTRAEGVIRIELAPQSGAEVIEVHDRAPEETKPLSYGLTAEQIRFIPGAGNDIRSRSAGSCCVGCPLATRPCSSTASRCRLPSISAA